MQMFVDAEDAYLTWTRWHPEGYVLNIGRAPVPSVAIVLHLAVCELISTRGQRYTTGDYIKICSLDRQELIEWAQREDAVGELSTNCHCLSSGLSTIVEAATRRGPLGVDRVETRGRARVDIFEEDETGYLAWIARHPSGFVINAPRARQPSTPRFLHQATCRSIAGAHSNYTTTTYKKLCSVDRAELERWAERDVGELRAHRYCLG